MTQRAAILNPAHLAGLVPDIYAAYRGLVVDGLGYFVDRLSPGRQTELIQAQSALPAHAGIAERLVRLMHDCPALHKLGQVLARRRELDATLRLNLQQLESIQPRTPIEAVRATLDHELRDARDRHRIQIADAALAQASVAVVFPIRYRDDDTGDDADGVLKVLRPGILDRLHEELDILAGLADYLDERRAQLGLAEFAFREIFDDVRELLAGEVCFPREQAAMREGGLRLAGRRQVVVPRVLPFSTPQVTAMERIRGVKVVHCRDGRGEPLARIIAEALIADVVFSREGSVLFHADPHAGNLFACDDGRLAVLDWALTWRITKDELSAAAQIIVGGMLFEPRRIGRGLARMALRLPADGPLTATIDAALRETRGGRPAGPSWLMRLLHSVVAGGGRLSPAMTLFHKTMVTLEGVLADLSGSFSLDEYLLVEGARRFAAEWPQRVWAPPSSRDFATHLSNHELMDAFAAAPHAAARFWTQQWGDWRAARQSAAP